MWIVLSGNARDGAVAHGPFETLDAAEDYAEIAEDTWQQAQDSYVVMQLCLVPQPGKGERGKR